MRTLRPLWAAAVKTALNLYHGDVHVLRIGDKLNDELKVPREYKGKIKDIKKSFSLAISPHLCYP